MKVTPYAEWSNADHCAAQQAMWAHADRMAGHPFVGDDAVEVALRRLAAGETRGAILGSYLLIYDVGPSWCSDRELLYELLLCRCAPGGSFTEAVEGMKFIAKVNGCYGVLTGNGVLRPGLARLLERSGAVKHSETYFIGVDNERFG